ncbi:hypothetical protein [Nocardioides sp.]|uniref:hypothetical protein n=1 Tax=Nocardioides sp. TaxID=35761 RepID=UPI002732FACA|nr:hypothetical protein [Nocardioides sp.]MDP3894721.1 hypothetical protein [Nocardioides sp.]
MTDTGDHRPPQGEHGEEVGNVAEEAAKLLGALSGWARDHGSDLGDSVSDLASSAAHAAHEANEHLATGAQECTFCPICRVVHAVRETSPEVKAHLAVAASSLMQAAAGMLATAVPDESRAGKARGDNVQHIDLDDDWPATDRPGGPDPAAPGPGEE